MVKQWVHALLNQAITQGIPQDQQGNWFETLGKGINRNQLTQLNIKGKL